MKIKLIHSLSILFLTVLFAVPSKKEFSKAFISVAEKGNPAVVSIIAEKEVSINRRNQFLFPFEDFFPGYGDLFPDLPEETYKNKSLGSGVIINDREGYIITNNHVIEDATEIKVVLLDKREVEAEIIGLDPLSDIAVIKIDSKDLDDVKIGDSDKLSVGEWVVAIGSPFGLHLNHTVTAGIVSAVGRSNVVSKLNYQDFIQHDAAINPGNSGGGLFDLDGNLIGINTAIATDGSSRANAGVGFAIPINQVKRVIDDLINGGVVMRGWLGVTIQDIDETLSKALQLNNLNGALVTDVLPDSPAENFGLESQDVIIKVNNKEVLNTAKLQNLISSTHPGDKVKLTIVRNNGIKDIMIEVGKRPDQEDLASLNSPSSIEYDVVGLKVEDTPEGVKIINIKKESPASNNNLKKGDIIKGIGRRTINSIGDYNEMVESYSVGDLIMLKIKRGKMITYLAFEI